MVKFAKIDIAGTSGDNVIVTGSTYPSQQLMILSYVVVTDTNCLMTFKSGASDDMSGPMSILANGGISASSSFLAPATPFGLMKTVAAGNDIIINLDVTANVGGHICYYVCSN